MITDDKSAIVSDLRMGVPARFVYVNYKGESARRHATFDAIFYGTTPWHPDPQWLIRAYDHDKGATRTFAFSGIDGASLLYGR